MANKKENMDTNIEPAVDNDSNNNEIAENDSSLPVVKDRMLEEVKIIIRNQGDESVGHEFIGINDFMMNIKRETPTVVPRYVYEHIKNTKGLKIVREGNSMREIPFNRFIVEELIEG